MEAVDQDEAVAGLPRDHSDYQVTLLERNVPAFHEWGRAGLGTLAIHLVLILLLLAIPPDQAQQPIPERKLIVAHLVDPPTRLTQHEPNRKPLSQEIAVNIPAVPQAPQKLFRPPKTAGARRPAPQPTPILVAAPPPQIKGAPQPTTPLLAQVTPQIQAPTQAPPRSEPPKLAFETPAAPVQAPHPTGAIHLPGNGVQDAVREIERRGASPRSVGDDTESTSEPSPLLNPTPSPTRPKSSLELVSDPKGVDFKPYLLQILQTVRRNWFAVMPESARLGQRGRVQVQFAVARDGTITKVVFTTESGLRAFDRAAVAALTASDPLPQLPPGFAGDRVVLQFTFLYNAPK